MSMLPIRYDDPLYDTLAARYESMYGLPSGILNAIRKRGERSNANQVSEAGAETPYQFIPPTRRGMINNYGVDPLAGPEEATKAAALLMKENYGRTKDWNDAVSMYHGGLDRRNWGPRTRAYSARVGDFQGQEAGMPLGQSMYPQDGYYPGQDPLAPLPQPTAIPERPKQAVPVPGDPGPSANALAASPAVTKKRGGILGALESVFMPDADSRWAAALRGGIWDAKANQAAYKTAAAKDESDLAMAQAKLKNLLTKGEYQIAGNNIVHFPAGGGDPEIITPPQTPTETERLIDKWRSAGPEDRALLERVLLKGNADPVIQSKTEQARIRAGATTNAARIRANAPSKTSTSTKPPAGFILDE